MTLEYLNSLKDEQKNRERLESKMFVDFIKQQDEYWEFQGLSEQIAFDKNQEDIVLISDQLFEWSSKAKSPEQKKILDNLFLKIIRVSTYIFHLETVSKHSISLYRRELKEVNRLVSEKKTLELRIRKMELEHGKEIQSLRKEIEFINSNNK